MLSAPHAVLQTRGGVIKCAERYTGMLCRLLHDSAACPVIYKTRHLGDDANHDRVSDYRDALCKYIRQNHIHYLIDLHQMKPERPMDVCLCTGKRRNLFGKQELVSLIGDCFREHHILKVTQDDPFDASSPYTVSTTVANRCSIPCVQVELNTRLLMNEYDEYCFTGVMSALEELISKLSEESGEVAL
ncbi:MAG: hypothetical protein EOM69_11775 [Clostridia bacterium]|nr:hypothetical protein [Clostridia bacterium]